ncbi:MAG: putative lipid II flippase FtsW [Candidatus Hydrogenedentota bacterium]|nr:MAG: putative lipid II flippase FtsW [Candidatus Hydrogenedentota bacterium]
MKPRRRHRETLFPPDAFLVTTTLFLMAVGFIFVYSAGVMKAEIYYGSTSHFLVRQALAAVIGIVTMIVLSRIPADLLERAAGPFAILTFLLLFLVLIPGVGIKISGARRWLPMPLLGRFQPSEFARLAVVIVVARYVARNGEEIGTWTGVGKMLLPPLLFFLLIVAEPDFDTAMMIPALALVILFVAGLPWRILTGIVGVLLAGAAALVAAAPYRLERIRGFLDPWSDVQGKGYHIIQGWTAMGSGGLFGKGIGQGVQKYGFLPEPHTDFIFAVIGEEIGLIGTVLVTAGFIVLAWRGYRAALEQKEPFARYAAAGVTALITGQALLNMMVVTGLAPTTGVPLPLISYGGTSIVFTCAAIGILLNFSRRRVSSGNGRFGG